MPCKHCGVEGPAKHVKFYQNIGMLVTRQWAKVEGDLCRPCIGLYFRSYTVTTLFLGWWGVISLLVTPLILLNNIYQYLSSTQLPEPGIGALDRPLGVAPPPVGTGSFKLKVIYGTIIWLVLLGFMAYMNVGFMERHAPAINAKLHSGEITDEADGEYAGAKIWKDIAALEADYKSKEWGGIRAELLSREPNLTELRAFNDKLQRRMVQERSQNLGANDNCEQLALDEMSPALDAYTKAQLDLFSFAKATTVLDKQSGAQLQLLGNQEGAALQRLDSFLADSHKQGCDK